MEYLWSDQDKRICYLRSRKYYSSGVAMNCTRECVVIDNWQMTGEKTFEIGNHYSSHATCRDACNIVNLWLEILNLHAVELDMDESRCVFFQLDLLRGNSFDFSTCFFFSKNTRGFIWIQFCCFLLDPATINISNSNVRPFFHLFKVMLVNRRRAGGQLAALSGKERERKEGPFLSFFLPSRTRWNRLIFCGELFLLSSPQSLHYQSQLVVESTAGKDALQSARRRRSNRRTVLFCLEVSSPSTGIFYGHKFDITPGILSAFTSRGYSSTALRRVGVGPALSFPCCACLCRWGWGWRQYHHTGACMFFCA